MKLRISFLLALLFGTLPLTALAQRAIAQSDELKSAINDVSQSVNRLDETAEARRGALNNIFDLTLTEIKELAAKDILVQASGDSEADIAKLAKFHLQILKNREAYINLLKRQANSDSTDLATLQIMAVNFKEWRFAYESDTKEIFDFLLLLQARSFLATADNRLALITADLKKLSLKTSKTDTQTLAQLLAGAQKNLTSARSYQDAGEKELLKAQVGHLTAMGSPVLLKQGIGGMFTCIPSDSFLSSACAPVFRLANGNYYLLTPSAELAKEASLKDLYQISGELLAITPTYIEYSIIGAIEVSAVNQSVNGPVILPSGAAPETDPAADKKPTLSISDNFRKSIKDEFSKISQTYSKYFFAMSKIAQKY